MKIGEMINKARKLDGAAVRIVMREDRVRGWSGVR
jgi:hypothetical protein